MYLREQDVQDDNTWGAGEKKKKKKEKHSILMRKDNGAFCWSRAPHSNAIKFSFLIVNLDSHFPW